MKVAILAGGRSSERDASLGTAHVIAGGLEDGGHEPIIVTLDSRGTWSENGSPLSLRPGEGLLGCDVVFPALHGCVGDGGTVQGLLEVLDVPYVGAGVFASSLCMDRAAFKHVLSACGLPQVRHAVVSEQRWRANPAAVLEQVADLGSTVFVKPARLGSPVGIQKITRSSRIEIALETVFSHDGLAVVEEYCCGDVVGCAVLGLAHPETSVPGQIVLRGADRYDHNATQSNAGYTLFVPAPIAPSLWAAIQRLAGETFQRVRCAGLARVDFFLDGDRVLVHEVDTRPGFTRASDFPRLWAATGLDLPRLCDRLLELAVERYRIERTGHSL